MAEKQLHGKKVILVVPPTQFREEEVFEPKRILEREGAGVLVASTGVRVCRGMREGIIESQAAIGEVNADEYDAILLAGGSSVPGFFWKDAKLQALVAKMAESGKVVAAISLSTVVLAKAKLLEGREATVYYLPEAIQELKNGGATYVNRKVVVDGRLITAEGPTAVGPFTTAVVSALAG